MITVHDLFNELATKKILGSQDVEISSVTADSRQAGPGVLFVAVKGSGADGHNFLPQALAMGCEGIVHQDPLDQYLSKDEIKALAVTVEVENTRPYPALLARVLADRPDLTMKVAAVTGTNGKTTVSYLLQEMLNQLAGPCGLLGTICYHDGIESIPAPLTTPGGPVFYHWLKRMANNHCRSVAMELSSHALDQDRTAGLQLDVAVMTNIGRDHLDYHDDIHSYVQAKASILELLSPHGVAVINASDEHLTGLDTGQHSVLYFDPRSSCHHQSGADLKLIEAKLEMTGSRLELEFQGTLLLLESPLVGRFNIENLMAAFGAGVALGFTATQVCQALAGVQQVPGRLERFVLPNGGIAVVDYAHTHDALEAVLRACGEISKGRLIVVFGCGGDRDKGKRPLMGQVAATNADEVWITSDNPRTENPSSICEDIAAGYHSVENPRSTAMTVVEDRKEALVASLAGTDSGDILIVAGKGHEDYQLVGNQVLPLDDRQLIGDWIEEHKLGN